MPSIRHVGRTPQALSGNVCLGFQYAPVGGVVASACLAAIPLIILFYMLAVRKAKGHVAAAAGLIGALIVAVAVWNMPVSLAISSTLNGAAFGLFPIVWIVITAVWVYNMTVESGEFEIIKDSLARLTDDRRLQALFIAYAFSCFIEGTAGFVGTPVAIAAAMLVGLGFTPLWGGHRAHRQHRSCRFRRHRRAAHRGGLRVRP